jgi:thiol-disulfide isomerase/thioredoxin
VVFTVLDLRRVFGWMEWHDAGQHNEEAARRPPPDVDGSQATMSMRRAQRPGRRLILYGKPGCCLCERAAALLQRISDRVPLEVVHVDITADPALEQRYGWVIPVVELDDGTIIESKISEYQVLRLLAAPPAG